MIARTERTFGLKPDRCAFAAWAIPPSTTKRRNLPYAVSAIRRTDTAKPGGLIGIAICGRTRRGAAIEQQAGASSAPAGDDDARAAGCVLLRNRLDRYTASPGFKLVPYVSVSAVALGLSLQGLPLEIGYVAAAGPPDLASPRRRRAVFVFV
jgi:hypothetical protein